MRGCLIAVAILAMSTHGALAQDAAEGEKAFGVCKGCHQVGENAKNSVGPVLNGVIGRAAGTVPEYSYSAANKASGLTWDEATLHDYLIDPKAKVPGTKMSFAGLKSEQKIKDLTSYLAQFDAAGKRK
ncbi:MAG: cytochrome c family protein [Xanthobacteraceae bacterium]|nr:cytochrome c family protein [Xanthobacteraceae bacterium]